MVSTFAPILAALVGLIGQAGISSRPERLRRKLAAMLEVADSMSTDPAYARARTDTVAAIEALASEILEIEVERLNRKFDWGVLVVGWIFAGLFAYLAYLSQGIEGWRGNVLMVGLGLTGLLMFAAGIGGARNRKDDTK